MSVAYSSKACRFPLTKLQRLLHLTWPQLLRMLQACQLLPDIDPDRCAAQHVTFLKASFSMPSKVSEVWRRGLHTLFCSLSPPLKWGFGSRLGLRFSGLGMWCFLKLVFRVISKDSDFLPFFIS